MGLDGPYPGEGSSPTASRPLGHQDLDLESGLEVVTSTRARECQPGTWRTTHTWRQLGPDWDTRPSQRHVAQMLHRDAT